ncbi:hypothetical protein PENNAL_c0134G08601 [Penicillium nalgiovense]|uniref:Uncharacterized protein n=1 Tax=Penicillium nalgiovense TaxID=60175 RepID=A0A1V6X2W6_PENNA|nr:hypothetical protein PENNAL_c0134G08601 [Penicillium nalgiovense]
MHGHPSEALLRSLILIINARYGPMTTMAAQGLRHSLANLMGMTVQRWTKSPTAPTQVTLWVARRFAARQTIHQLHGLRWKKPG